MPLKLHKTVVYNHELTQYFYQQLDKNGFIEERKMNRVAPHPNWSNLTKSIAMKWLNEGLEDRCITRVMVESFPQVRNGGFS